MARKPQTLEPTGCAFADPRGCKSAQKALRKGLLGHDVVEVLGSDLAISIAVRSLNHFPKLLFSHGFTQFLGDSLEILQANAPCFVIIEEVEDFADAVPRLFVA
mmetsp:Transcript_89612/g.109669  ORF Transcript_89612/g.109669 Transcript_89612/m.109669 type:complete len:104 (+) Transcript_89612:67-378(+)